MGTQPPTRTESPAQQASPAVAPASATSTTTFPSARPQPVEPTAGQAQPTGTGSGHHGRGTTAPNTAAHPQVTGPASDTRAPARGAPTTEDIRTALESLRATEERYQLDRVNTTGDVINAASLPPGPWSTSVASFYGGVLFGNGVACGGILHPWTLGVANKTLPCGTKVLFRYGSRAIVVKVIDRGPYVAGREWDLTAATAVALHFPGLGPVRWRIVK